LHTNWKYRYETEEDSSNECKTCDDVTEVFSRV
jgi:hypothetical protein